MSTFRKHPDVWICLTLSLLVLGITLPFLGHAFHIDEPLFMRIARQIQSDPLNPYGFYYLWNLTPEPMHKIAAFPPFFSYFLAAVSWGNPFPPEWIIHLALAPFALAASLGMYAFSRQMEFSRTESLFGAALLTISPVFVVSAGMVMPDVATLATAMLATVCAIQGWKKESNRYLILGGMFLGITPLLRYNGAPLIPILALLGLGFTSKKMKAFLPSLIGLGFLLAWMLFSSLGTGGSHTSEVLSVFAKFSGWMSRFWSLNIHLTLSTFIPFLLVPWFIRQNIFWWALVLIFSLNFAIYASPDIKRFALLPDILFFALGLSTLLYLGVTFYRAFRDLDFFRWTKVSEEGWQGFRWLFRDLASLKDNPNWIHWVFTAWIFIILMIPIIYVHFASKYLLLIQPPLILIVLRKLRESPKPVISRFAWAMAPALALSLSVAWADYSFANLYRSEAARAKKELVDPMARRAGSPDRWVWFTGHWGWQYYLEKAGAVPLPALFEDLRVGDWVLTAKYASATDLTPGLEAKLVQQASRPKSIPVPLRTMHPLARTGFYSNHWGPLPYNFSEAAPERINYFEVRPGTMPATSP